VNTAIASDAAMKRNRMLRLHSLSSTLLSGARVAQLTGCDTASMNNLVVGDDDVFFSEKSNVEKEFIRKE
jgi:hypothetical protein